MTESLPFVRFPKPLYDAALRAGFSGAHWEVFLVALRLTVGDRLRESAKLSVGAVEKASGRSRSHAKRALADLLREGVLRELKPYGDNIGRVIQVEMDPTLWGRFAVSPEDVPEYLRHDWTPVPSKEPPRSSEGTPRSSSRPRRVPPKEPTKERRESLQDSSPSGAKSARRRKGGARAVTGAHTAMTDGAGDPGRAHLYADSFDALRGEK